MLRTSLFYLSESGAAKRVVSGVPFARQMAERFVAGESLDDAVRAARLANANGLSASLDYLGEAVTTREEAAEAVRMVIATAERIAAEGLDANISVKPSQFGLDVDARLCRDHVERVLRRAEEVGGRPGEIFVRLDMESCEYTERTVALVEQLWERGHRNVGTVLQSYLHRTPDDLQRMMRLGSRVRLVKGAYQEPAAVAYPDKANVDRMFIDEMRTLLADGNYPAIATHDEVMISATRQFAFERGVAKDSFEFQMLYGIRRDLQQRLYEEGYRVRVYIPFGGSWYPYLMRRLAERPANLVFLTGNVLRESPLGRLAHPVALGAGAVAGTLATLAWRGRRNSR